MKFLGSATVSSRGQIVIPKKVRELLQINQGDDLIFAQNEKGLLCIVKEIQISLPDKK